MRTEETRTSARRLAAAKLLLLFFAILFALILGEIGTRIFSVVLHRPAILISDVYAGWSLSPNMQKVLVGGNGGRYSLSTDSDGRRVTYPREHSIAESVPLVLFLGDSFATGMIVEDEETFAWRLAERFPQYHFVNLGVLGYGTDQELVRLERFLQSNPHATIGHIIVLFFENDFRDSQRSYDPYLGRSKPSFRVTENGLVRGNYHRSVRDLLMDYSRLVWLANSKAALIFAPPQPPMAPGFAIVEACMDAMRALAISKGGQLHVFAYRRPVGSEIDVASWKQFLAQSKAVDVTNVLADARFIGYDGAHWNAAGHQQVADLMAKFLESERH